MCQSINSPISALQFHPQFLRHQQQVLDRRELPGDVRRPRGPRPRLGRHGLLRRVRAPLKQRDDRLARPIRQSRGCLFPEEQHYHEQLLISNL